MKFLPWIPRSSARNISDVSLNLAPSAICFLYLPDANDEIVSRSLTQYLQAFYSGIPCTLYFFEIDGSNNFKSKYIVIIKMKVAIVANDYLARDNSNDCFKIGIRSRSDTVSQLIVSPTTIKRLSSLLWF